MPQPDRSSAAIGLETVSLSKLTQPIYGAVMISMAFTGTEAKRWNPETQRLEDGEFFSHNDYDEAMAAIQELVRRAKGYHDLAAPGGLSALEPAKPGEDVGEGNESAPGAAS